MKDGWMTAAKSKQRTHVHDVCSQLSRAICLPTWIPRALHSRKGHPAAQLVHSVHLINNCKTITKNDGSISMTARSKWLTHLYRSFA